ncbi:hypothetical protein ACKI1I_17920 [Streptomyces turgidiscabies]|uniref:Putative lipoprotein n=1 Tax=Streptomyces turgidiscabies (strain Car8) TaxID=698760 RepID=L7FFY6_STRT8|nr:MULTISPECIES: hypothetical protein [Streptomyces]ELP69986.1 putative lipoprotein [Streptomyces turgidiscabies Car8]MDX3498004.1 hypothetical protein [Streptomyces turgidiscabies]GAQ69913.1 hypothetical protein T45_01644 [Streptomyces turgidiscabies]
MKRHAPPVAATFVATAALLMAACGGSDGESASTDDGKATGAAPTGEASPSRTASSADSAVATARPEIELPSDLSYVFDWPRTGDTDKDAVLADSEQSIKAVDLAIVNQDALDKAYLYYYEGEAAAGTEKFIQNYVDHKAGITGAYRFYSPVVAVDDDGTASLRYCEDQGKAFVKYLETDKVEETEVSAKSYVAYSTSLRKNSNGIWVILKMNSQTGSARCQP